MTPNTLKTVVIDGDRSLHRTYRSFFEMYLEYDLVGVYSSVAEAVADYNTVTPDVIFTEVSFSNECGIEGINQFRRLDPNVKIIMLSEKNDFELVKTAFKNSANGYLTKPVNERTLYNALDSIKSDGAPLSNDIAKKLISMFQRKKYRVFSDRENEVIEYLSQGATYKTIAEKLFVTASAINFHIQNIYLKLDVNSKSEALRKLRELDYA
ncbi:response regulator transcription factor [Maribacter sp. 2-571]|uniref:response regulator transcription factor n=1 Tax=Maribacter sp. 2-571 TaxID=3417569 RepID=UPI003D33281E